MRFLGGTLFRAWLILLPWSAIAAEPPAIEIVYQQRQHCGPACAETILRAYGDTEPWTRQSALGRILCARLPEFKRRLKNTEALERYYPDFEEAYQTELAEVLIDHGYCVVDIYKDPAAPVLKPRHWVLLKKHLLLGHMAIIYVDRHYLAAVGVDETSETLHYADTRYPWKLFACSFKQFCSGTSFGLLDAGRPGKGWDGRALIFWKGRPIDPQKICPACGRLPPRQPHTCPYRCYRDQRTSRGVQLALDALALSASEKDITRLDVGAARRSLNALLAARRCTPQDCATALQDYPVKGSDPQRLQTLRRWAADTSEDLAKLALDDLLYVVSGGEAWQERFKERLSGKD